MMHRGKRGYAGHNSKATLAAAASVFGLLLVIGVSLRSNAGVAFIAEEEEEEGANGVCSVVGAARKSREEEELFSGPLKRWRGREGARLSEELISTYLEHREKGTNQQSIAKTVFNVSLPNNEEDNRPHSYPFLSGDTLRAFSDVIYDKTSERGLLSYKEVWKRTPEGRQPKDGDVIFVRSGMAEDFAREILPSMRTRFVLITHNGDEFAPMGVKTSGMLDNDLLLHWFSVNADREHPKLSPVPIGLMNMGKLKEGLNAADFSMMEGYLRTAPPVYDPDNSSDNYRPTLLYVNFSPASHPLRKTALRTFKEVATYQEYGGANGERGQDQFWKAVVKSKFVLSPPGVGEDCHRTWESVLLGAIPVVRESLIREIFSDAPVFVLRDWESPKADESLFLNRRVRGPSFAGRRNIMAQYWFDRIAAIRDRELKRAPQEEGGA